jgi:hypothetical protein
MESVAEHDMRGRYYRMCALLSLALPLACTAQNEATRPVADEQQVLADSFADLVFGFCSALVAQNGEPKLDRVSERVTLRGPMPLSESGPLSGPLQARLKASPESMVYVATTPAVAVGRFHIAYAMVDGSACVALAQDMPDAVSKISARVGSDKQYKLQTKDGPRRIYVAAGGEQSITISMPATIKDSGMEEVQVSRSAR